MEMQERIQKIVEEIKQQGYESICLWMPVRSVGGGTLYLFFLARYLLDHTDIKVYYMDYSDGYAHDLLVSDARFKFINYDPNVLTFPVAEPVIVFTNSTKVIQIKNMNLHSKILFWHFETVPCAWDIVLLNRETKRFLKLTQKEHAMIFHDWSSRDILNRQYPINFQDENYLPLFLPPKNSSSDGSLIEKDVLNIGWLSRLGHEKVQSLYNLVDNLAGLQTDKRKRLVVIGDGRYRKDVEKYCKQYKDEIEVRFVGTIAKEELDEFLICNVDILFAMGTSVLEGAALKIPTVIVQLSMEHYDDDEFIWFHETKEYCVGIMHYQKDAFKVNYTRFEDIIRSVYGEDGKRVVGEKCYHCFIKHHSDFDAIMERFLNYCRDTTLTFEKLKGCIRFIPYNIMKVVQYQSHRIPLWTKIDHNNETIYKLFGLTLMKIRIAGNDKIFIPFGIRPVLHRFTLSGYQFPTSTFKDSLRNIKAEIPIFDKKNALLYKKQQHIQNLHQRVANGEKIRICLFVSRISCWNLEGVYHLLENSQYFEPLIAVKPFMFQGKEAMIEYMDTTYDTLKKKGLRVIKTYDKETETFLDLRNVYNPDVIFYTKYWRPQFHNNFYIANFLDRITFYSSYCFDIADHPECMDFDLNNAVDRYFMPSEIHREMAKRAMRNEAKNVYITGAPKLDLLLSKEYNPIDVWKPQTVRKKRIIWAPHHSDAFPNDLYQFNSFFELSKFMLDVAKKYQDKVQIAFKPHPMLKPKLDEKWGKATADQYYEQWAHLENGQLEMGEFVDLFRTSDAMIFDSISFIAEYTAVNKPALFTIGKSTRVKLNEFGMIGFQVLYKTYHKLNSDILQFIEEVVIGEKDSKKVEREYFISQYLLSPNGKTASENIYDNICEEIFGRIGAEK